MIVRLLTCAVSIACALPASAQEGRPPLEMRSGEPFRHANSGITLPMQLLDLPRTGGREYVQPQLDVLFTYKDAEGREELSVYVYRVIAAPPAVWFEEAIRPIGERPAFKRITEVELPVAFVPPGQTVTSGLRAAWTVSDSSVRSTALAIVPVGEWLVKFRYSSRVHEATSLVRRLDEMIAGVGWPATIVPAPAAARIVDCATPLKLSGESKPSNDDADHVLFDTSTAAGMEIARIQHKPHGSPVVEWCRDGSAGAAGPVYRPLGSDNTYLIPLTDSGQAVWARPAFWEPSDKPGPRWAVTHVLAGEMIGYDNRDRLPPPAQIDRIIQGAPLTHIATWGKIRSLKSDPQQRK